jgi:two-component system NtrC family sensor kinase
LNEQQETFVSKIRSGVTEITNLIAELLDLGRIEAGAAFEFSQIEMSAVIIETVETLRGHALAKQQWLQMSVPPKLPPVLGNRRRIGQVVSNLVGNAIKYTPQGGDIRIWAEEHNNQILVAVEDTGIGISAEDQARLFEKFYRVRSKDTEDIPGTGLGLAITKSIVEKHDGRIWVNSELGKGSTFTFLLPVHAGELQPV